MNFYTEKLIKLKESLENENSDSSKYLIWKLLHQKAEDLSDWDPAHQKVKYPEYLIAFFRLGLENSDDFEDKKENWESKMQRGLKNSIRLLQTDDQLKTANKNLNIDG